MTQKILVISGCKQSGKDSAMNYLAGYLLKQAGAIDYYELDDKGNLLIDYEVVNPETGLKTKELGWLDMSRMDPEFVRNASQRIWPTIKPYRFADTLKEVCVAVFQLNREDLYGTDEAKNKPSHIRWEDIYRTLNIPTTKQKNKTEFLSNRDCLEIIGTDICRSIYNKCWIESCYNRILQENWPFAVVTDCRFADEVEYSKEIGAKVVRLTRRPLKSTHKAETALLHYEGFDAVIDNTAITQEEKGQQLIRILQEWGWIS